MVLINIQIAEQNDIVFALLLHDSEGVGQHVKLGCDFIGIGMDVHEPEAEGLSWWNANNAELGNERLPMQQVVGIVESRHRRWTDFDAGRVVEEGILFRAIGVP